MRTFQSNLFLKDMLSMVLIVPCSKLRLYFALRSLCFWFSCHLWVGRPDIWMFSVTMKCMYCNEVFITKNLFTQLFLFIQDYSFEKSRFINWRGKVFPIIFIQLWRKKLYMAICLEIERRLFVQLTMLCLAFGNKKFNYSIRKKSSSSRYAGISCK